MSQYDIIVVVDIMDWRDVPADDEKRAEMLRDIAVEAAWAAKRLAEDKFDIAVKLGTEIKGVTL